MTLLVYSYGLNTRRYLWLFLIWMFTVMAFAVSEYVQIGFVSFTTQRNLEHADSFMQNASPCNGGTPVL